MFIELSESNSSVYQETLTLLNFDKMPKTDSYCALYINRKMVLILETTYIGYIHLVIWPKFAKFISKFPNILTHGN